MIGKRPTPVIGNLTGSSVSGSRTGTMDGTSSPRSPLDFKIQSPRGLKGYDFGGVGLAIVAALDDNKSCTKVYCNGTEQENRRLQGTKFNRSSVFDISPAKFGDFPRYPDSDFLSSCHLCNKKLHGKDIYMYRGEKAFCSTECRYSQIVMDEHKEKCSSEISRSVDIATSPYANDQIFSTGILAI
nr:FCS-Like Zinc finger 13-like [Nicotiana tomentosiformis]